MFLVVCLVAVLYLQSRATTGRAPRREAARGESIAREAPTTASHPDPGENAAPAPRAEPQPTPAAATEGAARLRVRVVDGMGEPVRDAVVERVVSASREYVVDRRAVDETGTVEYESVKPKPTPVTAIAGDLKRYREITLVAGKTTRVEFVMAGATVEGQVRLVSGAPLEGIELMFTRKGRKEGDRVQVTTQAGGQYRASPVPPGSYIVSTRPVEQLPRIRYATLSFSGTDVVKKDFVFGRLSLKGTVRDKATGRPVEGARVCASTPRPLRRESITDPEGAYSFTDFPAGSTCVMVEKRGYARYWGNDVAVDDETTRVLNIELVGEARLRILFTDTRGNPIPGRHDVSLRSSPYKAQGFSVVTDGEGWGVLDAIAPGAYEVHVRAKSYVLAIEDVDATHGETVVRFRLAPRSEEAAPAELSGVVRDAATNRPIAGVRLRTTAQATAVTNGLGEFRFARIWAKEKEFQLYVQSDGYAPQRFLVKNRTRPQEIRLRPAVLLRLRLLDRDGDPIAGERAVYSFRSREPLFRWTTRLESDEDGWVEYRGLVPARYSISRSGPAGDLHFRVDVPPEGLTRELKLGRK